MNIRKMVSLAVLTAVLGLTGSGVWADGAGKPQKDTEPAKQPVKQSGDVLTDETLKVKLENLGYEPKVIKSKTGGTMYLLNFVRDNYRFVFYVSLSTDKSRLWLSSALHVLPEGSALRADILEKILARNDDMAPTYFSVRSGRRLYIELCLDNHGLNAGRLRREIDGFAVNIRSSEHLWNPARYPKVEGPKVEGPKDKGPKVEK